MTNGEATDSGGGVYSLGAVIFYMLVGKPPFRGKAAVDTIETFPEDRTTLQRLALVLWALQTAGLSVGWGLQFQSPLFLAAMIALAVM